MVPLPKQVKIFLKSMRTFWHYMLAYAVLMIAFVMTANLIALQYFPEEYAWPYTRGLDPYISYTISSLKLWLATDWSGVMHRVSLTRGSYWSLYFILQALLSRFVIDNVFFAFFIYIYSDLYTQYLSEQSSHISLQKEKPVDVKKLSLLNSPFKGYSRLKRKHTIILASIKSRMKLDSLSNSPAEKIKVSDKNYWTPDNLNRLKNALKFGTIKQSRRERESSKQKLKEDVKSVMSSQQGEEDNNSQMDSQQGIEKEFQGDKKGHQRDLTGLSNNTAEINPGNNKLDNVNEELPKLDLISQSRFVIMQTDPENRREEKTGNQQLQKAQELRLAVQNGKNQMASFKNTLPLPVMAQSTFNNHYHEESSSMLGSPESRISQLSRVEPSIPRQNLIDKLKKRTKNPMSVAASPQIEDSSIVISSSRQGLVSGHNSVRPMSPTDSRSILQKMRIVKGLAHRKEYKESWSPNRFLQLFLYKQFPSVSLSFSVLAAINITFGMKPQTCTYWIGWYLLLGTIWLANGYFFVEGIGLVSSSPHISLSSGTVSES